MEKSPETRDSFSRLPNCPSRIDADAAVDGLAADDAAQHVDDLQGGFALVANDELAVAEEGEGLIATVCIPVGGNEHQLEAALVVRRLGIEGVARRGQQVYIGAGHVIDEVEVVHFHVLGVDREGVLAVLVGAEVDGHFTLAVAADDGVFLCALRDVEVGILLAEVELGQLVAFVEAHDGVVECAGIATVGGLLGQGHLDVALVACGICGRCGKCDLAFTSIDYYARTSRNCH